MGVSTQKTRRIAAIGTFLSGVVTSGIAGFLLLRYFCEENGGKMNNSDASTTFVRADVFPSEYSEKDSSRFYGEAGGEFDFFFGTLPRMDPTRLKEPNVSDAKYLSYQCGKDLKRKDPWLFSIAVLNPSDLYKNFTLKQIAARNRRIRNNQTKIEKVVSVCGGVLVASRWGITAHHCLSENRHLKVIIYGRENLDDLLGIQNDVLEIDQVYFYPGYNDETNENDIALIKLKKEIISIEEVQIACLPNPNVIPETSKVCEYAGWGLRSTSLNKGVQVPVEDIKNSPLARFKVTLEDPTSCQQRYKRLKYDVNYNLCDENNTSRVVIVLGNETRLHQNRFCSGFSGGPLTCVENNRRVVYGIVNWGEESCNLNAGRGYALISTRMEWICCTAQLSIPNCDQVECTYFND